MGVRGQRENREQEVIRPDIPVHPLLRKARREEQMDSISAAKNLKNLKTEWSYPTIGKHEEYFMKAVI